jgi:hypothetical protein
MEEDLGFKVLLWCGKEVGESFEGWSVGEVGCGDKSLDTQLES